jgi:hypothetical protein
MPKKNLKRIFTISLSCLFLISCGTISLKDGQVCGDMGRLGATCDNVFTDKPIDYSAEKWDELRIGRISITASMFANWKSALLKFCSDTGRCRVEEEEAIKEIGKKLDDLNKKIERSAALQDMCR